MLTLVLFCNKCLTHLDSKGEMCSRIWEICCFDTFTKGYLVSGHTGKCKTVLKYLESMGYVISTDTATENRYRAVGLEMWGNVSTFCSHRLKHYPHGIEEDLQEERFET